MKWAFYKNWKKMALVLTSMFWASCGDDASSTAPETSSESSSSVEASSSDSAAPGSSNAVPASNANEFAFSSEEVKSSSSVIPASSTEKIACAKATLERYEGLPCDGEICPDYGVVFTEVEGIKCEDGEEYELESICPDYGIPAEPCSDTYFGKNGKVYSAEEFKKIYEIDSRQ